MTGSGDGTGADVWGGPKPTGLTGADDGISYKASEAPTPDQHYIGLPAPIILLLLSLSVPVL